ncbi:MAG: hypothetical protein ABIQ90_10400 [Polaromonas sp.]
MNRSRDLPTPARRSRLTRLVWSALLLAGASQAQNLTPPAEESIWLAASNQALDQLRGGFDAGAGLLVSFGISRAVFINGQLVTSTSFQVADMSKLTSAQAQVIRQQMSSQALVVQNGAGNRVDAAAIIPLAMIVQNTLNNQTIRNETTIQATSSGLGLVKSLNLQATLNDSINNAVRNR